MFYKHFICILSLLLGAILPCMGQQKMIILHPPCFKQTADSLAMQKEHTGINCITWECTLNKPESIKQHIDSLTLSFPAEYMLILGDFEHIPSYECMEWLSDIYYATDSNGYAHMAVGRLSAQNTEQLQYMLQKNTPAYLQNMTTIASSSLSALTGKTDIQRLQDLSCLLADKGILTTRACYSTPEYTLQAHDITQAVDNGTDLLVYAGHGDYTGWNTGNYTISDIDSLHNTRYPIVIAAACLNGHFAHRTCMAEAWMQSPYGAKAVVMSSALCDHDANLESLIHSAQQDSLPATLGQWWLMMYHYTTFTLHRKNDAQAWILFGDPSMPISTGKTNTTRYEPDPPLRLYPNPARNTIHLDSQYDIQHTEIYTINGQKIKDNQGADIDISALKAGPYMLKVHRSYFLFIKQ